MNLLLSDDYLLQDYPEDITSTIRSGHSTCVRFNHKGDYLASGRVDGTVVVWDLDTMGVARKLRGHSKNITSLSWSKRGRYLLSACQGWMVILWDLQDGKRHREVRFTAPVYGAELHPENQYVPPALIPDGRANYITNHWSFSLQFVAALFEEQPVLVDITQPIDVKYTLPSVPRRPATETDAAVADEQTKGDAKTKHTTTAAVYTATGDHIIAGTSKGRLNIIDAKTREIIYTEKIAGGVIATLRLTESGKDMLVNAHDRIIRTFHLPDLSSPNLDPDTIQVPLEHKFQDVVNRLSWNHVAFSATGEYVAASTFNNHELYIWERGHGSLVRMLEGPKEEQGVVEWHPHKPILAACGMETGSISIWSVTSPQRWSALAPDFVEVEENVEYVEKEDEFDIHPHEEIQKRRLDQEDEDVDVLTRTNGAPGVEVFRMPILYNLGESDSEEEFVKSSFGTLRRKSPGDQDDGEGGGEDRSSSGKRGGGRGRGRKK